MTDAPRFTPVKATPRTAHQHYFGGRLVQFVFDCADRSRARRRAASGDALSAMAAHRPCDNRQASPSEGAKVAKRLESIIAHDHARIAKFELKSKSRRTTARQRWSAAAAGALLLVLFGFAILA